jgi:hypothetical protein
MINSTLKKALIGVAIVVGIALIAILGPLKDNSGNQQENDQPSDVSQQADPKTATYSIEGETFALANGEADVQVDPGVFMKVQHFFDQTYGNMNVDEIEDVGVVLSVTTSKSDALVYAAVLASTPQGGWVGTNAVLVGDRITMKTIDIYNNRLIVTYTQPSAPAVEKVKHYQVRNGVLVEVPVK